MSSDRPVPGIINGHWEPSPPRSPKVVSLVRGGLAKLLHKLSPSEESATAAHSEHERESKRPIAAE